MAMTRIVTPLSGAALRDIEPSALRRWRFSNLARSVATLAGRPIVFAGSVLLIILWAASGPLFGFSDTWQLIVNTTTTIITFLMVALLQNSQTREDQALQHKLNAIADALDRKSVV